MAWSRFTLSLLCGAILAVQPRIAYGHGTVVSVFAGNGALFTDASLYNTAFGLPDPVFQIPAQTDQPGVNGQLGLRAGDLLTWEVVAPLSFSTGEPGGVASAPTGAISMIAPDAIEQLLVTGVSGHGVGLPWLTVTADPV
ncbi:MAG: hypothetical protein KDA60_07525, partial [Planctomycetales bacterium]|nr:hypothetical protein [Planctomycetales bacterium]